MENGSYIWTRYRMTQDFPLIMEGYVACRSELEKGRLMFASGVIDNISVGCYVDETWKTLDKIIKKGLEDYPNSMNMKSAIDRLWLFEAIKAFNKFDSGKRASEMLHDIFMRDDMINGMVNVYACLDDAGISLDFERGIEYFGTDCIWSDGNICLVENYRGEKVYVESGRFRRMLVKEKGRRVA